MLPNQLDAIKTLAQQTRAAESRKGRGEKMEAVSTKPVELKLEELRSIAGGTTNSTAAPRTSW